jgi:hypothetical protein
MNKAKSTRRVMSRSRIGYPRAGSKLLGPDSPPLRSLRRTRFCGLSLSDFGQIFITQQAQVDVDNVEGVKLF